MIGHEVREQRTCPKVSVVHDFLRVNLMHLLKFHPYI